MNSEEQRLKHDLANAQQEKIALKSLLKRAADELDHLAEADCNDRAKEQAERTAQRLRQASSI